MNVKLLSKNILLLGMFIYLAFSSNATAQTFKDDIMLQAFGWDVHEQASVKAEGGLYNYLNNRSAGYATAGFSVLWMPPPSKSTGGVGYIPTELFDFSQTVYGTEEQLKTVLTSLKSNSIHPMADIVVNHRGGSTNWTDFTNPTWDCHSITSNDEANFVTITGVRPCGNTDTGEDFGAARDLDHTNAQVQNGVKEYLTRLKALGFDSWRWDVAKGFSASYFGDYITASTPYASVGEYWDGNANSLKSWIDGTGGKSTAFDFALYYKLGPALKGDYGQLAGGYPGLAGIFGYADKAVTFVDNHDTFVKGDSQIVGDNIMKGYAYILTHPGIPCVFFPHYYGGTYKKDGVTVVYNSNETAINKIMAVRKANAISAHSSVVVSNSGSFYSAIIDDKVAVRIGPNSSWTPSGTGWVENASGTDYKVWSKSAINVAPTANIATSGGSFAAGTTVPVTITATDDKVGSTIYYTTDGSIPTVNSSVYSAAINVSTTTTIKAIAKDSDGLLSGVASQTYTFLATTSFSIYFKPPTTTPNWTSPKIHFWGATPTGSVADADWATPVNMTVVANNAGWYKYTFTNLISINLLFRNGVSTGTLGVTKTGDILNVSKEAWYEWDASNAISYLKEVTLSSDDFQVVKNKVCIYPNPVSESFKINADVSDAYISDITGRIVKQFKGSFDRDTNFQIGDLVNGTYFVNAISVEGVVSSMKFIKE